MYIITNMKVIDLNPKDNQKELILSQTGMELISIYDIYSNKKLIHLGRISNKGMLLFENGTISTNKYIESTNENQYKHLQTKYKIVKNKLTKVSENNVILTDEQYRKLFL